MKLKFVCVPVDKNGEGIFDAAAHLACYQVVGSSLSPRPTVEVSTQFQTSRFELKRPKLLCLPATKTLLPSPLEGLGLGLDPEPLSRETV
jgi:hypothetical protein